MASWAGTQTSVEIALAPELAAGSREEQVGVDARRTAVDQLGQGQRHRHSSLVVLLLARADQLTFVGGELEAERVAVVATALEGEELAEAEAGEARS